MRIGDAEIFSLSHREEALARQCLLITGAAILGEVALAKAADVRLLARDRALQRRLVAMIVAIGVFAARATRANATTAAVEKSRPARPWIRTVTGDHVVLHAEMLASEVMPASAAERATIAPRAWAPDEAAAALPAAGRRLRARTTLRALMAEAAG